MEAVAVHDFHASSPDELSFSRGSVVKVRRCSYLTAMLTHSRQVINKQDDPNWYKAEQDGRSGFIPANYIELRPHEYVPLLAWFILYLSDDCVIFGTLMPHVCRWYHGKISRTQAEDVLMTYPTNGAYLFRDSESSPGGGFSLSVR